MNRLTIETIDAEDTEQIDSLMAQILKESTERASRLNLWKACVPGFWTNTGICSFTSCPTT